MKLSKILIIIRQIARKKDRLGKWQNRLIPTSGSVLDAVNISYSGEVSDQLQDTDSNVLVCKEDELYS